MNRKEEVLKIFTKHETTLYSIFEIMDKLKLDDTPTNYKNIENIVRNFRMSKVLSRHKEKDSNDDFQYAAKMKASDIEPWILNGKISTGLKGMSKRTSKIKLRDSKEIRAMFAAQYNALAKLEDEVMKIINENELTQKEMSKIRKLIGK